MSKKFCLMCKFHIEGKKKINDFSLERTEDLCDHPNNFKDDYLSEKRSRLSTPAIINRFNDCSWYTERTEDS